MNKNEQKRLSKQYRQQLKKRNELFHTVIQYSLIKGMKIFIFEDKKEKKMNFFSKNMIFVVWA